MMNLTSFSQNTTTTKRVKVSTLKKIKKDLDKCDSTRVAYKLQVRTLDILVESNLRFFEQIQQHQIQQEQLQKQIDDSVKALRKKKNNWILPTSIGVVAGLVGGAIINN